MLLFEWLLTFLLVVEVVEVMMTNSVTLPADGETPGILLPPLLLIPPLLLAPIELVDGNLLLEAFCVRGKATYLL